MSKKIKKKCCNKKQPCSKCPKVKKRKEMNIDLKNNFEIVEEGTTYEVPEYKVVEGNTV